MKLTNMQKRVAKMLDRLVTLPHYRAEPWVLTRQEVKIVCDWSVAMFKGEPDTVPGYETMLDALTNAIDLGYCRVARDQEDDGLAWLWSQHKRGWLTTGCLRIMRQVEFFTFRGCSTKQLGMRWQAAPLYTVHGSNGTFMYAAWSWQSGVKPSVVSCQYLHAA